MSNVFGRSTKAHPPAAVRGAGCYLYDAAGKAYLDGSGGAAVSCLGHGDPHVTAAIKAQVDQLAFAHTGFFTSEPAEALAARLVGLAPEGIDKVYFVSGGSEAMEAGLKLARQYYLEIGEPKRTRVIARRQSYHGNTLGALATGGNPLRRAPYAPLLMETRHVAPCYAYRGKEDGEDDAAYAARLVAEFEAEIEAAGPETVMAFVAEPVVGATLGAVPAVAGYFAGIRAVCDRYGILLILDEVMCGMGRTGTLFACAQEEGVRPDIVTIAKGLGAGYQPIGAMLCQGAIYDAIAQGSGAFKHGHTYIGHPVACAGSLAVIERLVDQEVLGRVNSTGERLKAVLEERFAESWFIGDIRGRGLFLGLELVQDRQSKEPFEPDRQLHARIKTAAFEAGLICYPNGGTVDGQRGDHILLAPPFILSDAQIDELTDKLGHAMAAALETCAA